MWLLYPRTLCLWLIFRLFQVFASSLTLLTQLFDFFMLFSFSCLYRHWHLWFTGALLIALFVDENSSKTIWISFTYFGFWKPIGNFKYTFKHLFFVNLILIIGIIALSLQGFLQLLDPFLFFFAINAIIIVLSLNNFSVPLDTVHSSCFSHSKAHWILIIIIEIQFYGLLFFGEYCCGSIGFFKIINLFDYYGCNWWWWRSICSLHFNIYELLFGGLGVWIGAICLDL